MKSQFPPEPLRPESGRISSLIFENEHVNLSRNHFWSFRMQFADLTYKGAIVRPSMTIDWVTLPIRRWKDLAGLDLSGGYGDRGIEASFYVWEHDFGEHFSLKVKKRNGTQFLLEMKLTVDFTGYDGTDADGALQVSAEQWVPYVGLRVDPEGDARIIASPFMDMTGYRGSDADSRVFEPIV